MAQQHTPAAGSGHTIRLDSIQLVLSAAKLRRYTNGRTCALAALTAGPVLHADCSTTNRLRLRDDALRVGNYKAIVTPLERGHLTELVLRTRLHHGLAEVRKTWGTGLRALLDEPRHVLNGGRV